MKNLTTFLTILVLVSFAVCILTC